MEYDVDVAAVKGIIGHLFIEVGVIHIVKEIEALKVAALAAVGQVVDDDDVVDAPIIQLLYDIAADKTGTACYYFIFSPSLPNQLFSERVPSSNTPLQRK